MTPRQFRNSTAALARAVFRGGPLLRFAAAGLAVLALSMLASPAGAVGFRTLDDGGLRISVWYPSPAEEREFKLGPFDAVLAVDAEPVADGRHQIVLLSHGRLGRPRNHHLTAKALVGAGFIVIAPLHTPDHLMVRDGIPKGIVWRVAELRHAMEAVLEDPAFRGIADTSRVHALGYSLGGLTALGAAGAPFSVPEMEDHCGRENDPEFCTPLSPIAVRIAKRHRKVVEPDLDAAPPYPASGFVNGAVAVVAPVGQGVGIDADTFLAKGVMVIGLERDTVTIPRFHAAHLNEVFSRHVETEYHLIDAHHHAFISPFAKRVTDVEDIPVAKDPEGFDRRAFLDDINARLAGFFGRHRG